MIELADGGVETWLVYDAGFDLGPVGSAALLDEANGRAALARLWRSYVESAGDHGLDAIIGTPTWRAAPNAVAGDGRPSSDVVRLNAEAVSLHRELVDEAGPAGRGGRCRIAGVIGPRGDGYDPTGAPTVTEAMRYHTPQIEALASAGCDLLFAVPLPAAAEAEGLCRAMAETALPFVPSFLIDAAGRLPDGSLLVEVVADLDARLATPPAWYSLSCVHPTTVLRAVASSGGGRGPHAASWARIEELKANGSAMPPAVLDRSDRLVCDPPDAWTAAMVRVIDAIDLRIAGGCCGTGPEHIEHLAAALERRQSAAVDDAQPESSVDRDGLAGGRRSP